MESFFARHTKQLSVRDDNLQQLWNQNKLAIHYPDRLDGSKSVDNDSKLPEEYPDKLPNGKRTNAKTAMGTLKELADSGGYVWVENRKYPGVAKVGKVNPQCIEIFSAQWTYNPEYSEREGTPAALKTVRIDEPRLIRVGEAIGLRAAKPRQGTIVRWHKCGTRLADLIEGNTPLPEWENLSTEQQEAACAEFLRYHEETHPLLRFLLLPVGRTLKDIDIYGLDKSGNEIFAQVTYYGPGVKKFDEKLKKLKQYANRDKDTKLIYFCDCDDVAEDDGVHYIPVKSGKNSVLSWIKRNSTYCKALFS